MFRIPSHVFKRMPPHDGEQGQQPDTIDLAQATLQLVKLRAPGLYHVANSGQATWCELAAEAVRQASLPCSVRAVASSDKTLRANYEVLSSAKYTALTGCPMRPWSQALREYIYSVLLASQ